MFPALAISLILLSPVYAQVSPPVLGDIATFTELGSYLKAHTNGAVRPVKDSYLSFRINQKSREATPILPEENPDLIHSLFETDVLKYIQNEGAVDFVSAKKKYYRSQTFNNSTQQFSRSYVYPSDWHSLNHNPLRKINLPTEVYGQQFEPLDLKSIEQSPLLGVKLHRDLDEMTGTEMTAGNKLRLLNNGEVSFKEKVRMVRQAKKFFHSVVMVQYCDESSSEIVDAMIDRARAGVDVRLMAESVWTKLVLKKCLKKLRNGGVKVTLGKGFFNPRTMFTVHHTKFWIRDGEEAIIGGQNMHDFENSSNGFNNHTRDKDVHVTGPAVTDMMREYIRIWNHEHRNGDSSMTQYMSVVRAKEAKERTQGLRGTDLYEQWLNNSPEKIPGVCRVLIQGTKTSDGPSIISKAYIEIMKNAKYSMIINSPTFRYKEKKADEYNNSLIIKTLLDGSKRGVKVDIISNGVDGGWGDAGHQLRTFAKSLRRKGKNTLAFVIEKLDKITAIFIGRSNRKNLARAVEGSDVDVWLYFNHIHAKQMSFDHIMTSTGSFNLDSHSYKNHESTMICLDKKLADESLISFISDIVNSTPVIQ
jgi:phosphatidylserine/phosphatidylglycerophosphate/cardiolipin synthase-like enzyme